MVEDLRLAQHTAGIVHQVAQQLVFRGAQVDGLAGTGYVVRILVDLQIAHANDRILFGLFARAAQNGTNACHDLFEAEWLGDVIIAADGQTHHLVLRIVAGGEEQDRSVDTLLADAPGDGESVNVREHDVEHDEIGLDLFDDFDGFRAGGCGRDFEIGEMEGRNQQFVDGRFVVDDDNR